MNFRALLIALWVTPACNPSLPADDDTNADTHSESDEEPHETENDIDESEDDENVEHPYVFRPDKISSFAMIGFYDGTFPTMSMGPETSPSYIQLTLHDSVEGFECHVTLTANGELTLESFEQWLPDDDLQSWGTHYGITLDNTNADVSSDCDGDLNLAATEWGSVDALAAVGWSIGIGEFAPGQHEKALENEDISPMEGNLVGAGMKIGQDDSVYLGLHAAAAAVMNESGDLLPDGMLNWVPPEDILEANANSTLANGGYNIMMIEALEL